MIKLKDKKTLIAGICISAAMLLLILLNITQFWASGSFEWEGALKCLVLFALMTALLIFKINLPKWIESVLALIILFTGPFLIFEMVRILVEAPNYTS